MLREIDYSRQLDAMLDQVGNGQSAVDKLNAALENMPDYDEVESDPMDWPEWTDKWTWEITDDWESWLTRTTLED